MKKIIFAQFLILLFLTAVWSQQKGRTERYVEIPTKYGAVFIMNQPDSPLVFEEVQLLTDEKGLSPQVRYLVRNKSAKLIISFSIEFQHKSEISQWGRYGNSWVENIGKKDENIVIIPLNGIYENIEKNKFQLIPMTNEISDIFKSEKGNSEIKTIWIGFIRKAVFEDGSQYEVNNLSDYLNESLNNY